MPPYIPRATNHATPLLVIRTANSQVQEALLNFSFRRTEIGGDEARTIQGASGLLGEPEMDAVMAEDVVAGCEDGLAKDLQAD